jgi:hypothetical protein
MTETELWEKMMDGKNFGCFLQAFATLSRPIAMRKWRGHGMTPEFDEVHVPAGTKVRVVMASRLGDVGITDDLLATSGYHYRTTCIDGELNGPQGPVKLEPAGLLENIEMIYR